MEKTGMTASNRQHIYALIGGIGSGKSMAARILCDLGAYIIDADDVSREVFVLPEVEIRLKELFPDCLQDGKANRAAIKRKVFYDKTALASLENLTHPLINKEMYALAQKANAKIVFLVYPLLGFTGGCEGVLNISAPHKKRIERIVSRDNITEELAEMIISNQASDEDRMEVADWTIDNDGNKELFEMKIKAWWKENIEKKI